MSNQPALQTPGRFTAPCSTFVLMQYKPLEMLCGYMKDVIQTVGANESSIDTSETRVNREVSKEYYHEKYSMILIKLYRNCGRY
jgi:hypothetical protein